jgi:rubredoxin
MTPSPAEPTTPVACPDCQSDNIKGPEQPGAGLSYWRCLKCGIVWNPERPPDRSSQRSAPRSTQNRAADYWKNR